MARKATNDQGELIQAIKDRDRRKAWQLVKFIGIKENSDANSRFLIFNKAFESFDPERNNNFILFYKNMIGFDFKNRLESETYRFTSNRNIINTLKSHSSSPQEDLPDIIKDIEGFIR